MTGKDRRAGHSPASKESRTATVLSSTRQEKGVGTECLKVQFIHRKIEGKVQKFSYTPPLPPPVSPIINIVTYRGAFLIIDEPVLIHYN